MKTKYPRRNFIGKLSMLASAAAAMPLLGLAKTFNKNESMGTKNHSAVKNIKALGFQWETSDPFLFCVHHEDKYPKGNSVCGPNSSLEGRHIGQDFILKDGWRMYHGDTVPGFPGHPHRGFETITVVKEGMVDHADSLGAAGRYGNGDVQWMTAGIGVQHSEMFPLLSQDKENPMELFQIWLNLPKKSKMVPANFTMLWSESIPRKNYEDANGNKTEIEIIAGPIEQEKLPLPPPDSWASDPANNVAVWNIKMEANAEWTMPKTIAGTNRTLYFYQGKGLSINGIAIAEYHAAEVLPDQNLILRSGPSGAKILVLQGNPIAEPVVQHGPFVMNTKEEISQAFNDYHRTQFGGWPWPKRDQVHDRSKGRFAKYVDGKIEEKG
ncbi:MAG: pirin family protein [Salibacteraceae bacterium]|nr:pirin family protein [Salibacteraceae bacterium]